MKEEWKDIIGYEEYYQVSNLGRVRSKDRIVIFTTGRKCFYKSRLMKIGRDTHNYPQIRLYNKGGKSHTVHRLVAKAFISNPNNLIVVNHKDGNKQNNQINNLEWVTSQQNTRHSVANKLHAYGIKNGKSKINNEIAKQIYNLAVTGNIQQKDIAKKFNISKSLVSEIKCKKIWIHIHE